ncbi:type II secretion system protein E [Staphylococcus piscifermentans]|uniref:Competence protein ComGA n=2 Tax=Staphylococcus piscifermentans TaxID=70258 RepID=A0A239U3A7_9STAP|nr:competence type IV pilus ATPase ComGA [Staphylococcus piscifermentans]GEP84730.1 competence protein ComGA [Staphylococcus piscifermentans]SNV03898.1 type II secretion system protein E [Staphylococcus piscifermentans]
MKKLLDQILKDAIAKNVSDIHFIPLEKEVSIKFRVNDDLINYDKIEILNYSKLLTFMKFQAGLDVSNYHQAQSGQTTFKHQTLYNLRISTLPLSLGMESCVIRLSPQYYSQDSKMAGPKNFYHLMNKKQGLILFTGPTGSGKSTMMYEMVAFAQEHLNLNIITVEDPVEKRITGITQISVNEKAGINYESSFKAILRCDPDIILIGEIRDAQIAKCVIHAALSGHLVLSTLHSNDCEGALLRLLEMGVTPQEAQQSIALISNQRLVTNQYGNRELAYETMYQSDIQYFFKHDYTMPKHFMKLSKVLTQMSEEGVICEEILERYT